MSKTQRIQEVDKQYNNGEKEYTQPLSNTYDDDIFDALAPTVPFNTLPIADIWADVKQPRRAIPGLIRINWNGDPAQVAELLNRWQQVAEQKAGKNIPIEDILTGQGDGFTAETNHPHFEEFLALLRLGQSIHHEGLINPITFVKFRDKHIIETGERRWLAHHLLAQYVDAKYGKVPAIESVSGDSLWRQAHENTARRQLNAIGMARQLALLIMDLRKGMTDYDSYAKLVEGCDRIFYEQISNGRLHPIPPNMSERVSSAMGLSIARVNQFRALLKLTEDNAVNDVLWLRADEENWGDTPLREIASLPIETLRDIVLGSQDWTYTDLQNAVKKYKEEQETESNIFDSSSSHNSDDSDTKPTRPPKELLIKGTIIRRDMDDYWVIEDIYAGGNAFYCASPTGYKMQIAYEKITAIANDKADLFKPKQSEPDKRPSLDAWYGIRVQSPEGLVGKVNGVSGAMLNCRTEDGKTFSVLPSDAKLVDKDYQPEGRVSVDVKTGKVSGDTPPESGGDTTPDNPQQTSIPKDKFGVPLLEGATVRTRVGRTGRVTGYNGRLVTVNVNGLRTDHAPDTLEVIPSDTFLPTPEEKAHIESFLDGDRVQLCRQVGGLSEGIEGVVKVWDDGERAVVFDGTVYYTSRVKVDDQRSHILLWCDLIEVAEAGDEATDQQTETTSLETSDGEILDESTLELLEGLMQAARACDIQQWIILDDLTKLNREQLRKNIAQIGIAAVERMTVNYQTMTKEMLMQIENRFNDHMQHVLMAALEIAKEKQ